MNLRPNDELEKTQVTKMDDVKERGRLSPRHQALAWWDKEQHPGTCIAGREARERRQDVHGGGLGGADTKGETPATAPSMHSVESHLKVSL